MVQPHDAAGGGSLPAGGKALRRPARPLRKRRLHTAEGRACRTERRASTGPSRPSKIKRTGWLGRRGARHHRPCHRGPRRPFSADDGAGGRKLPAAAAEDEEHAADALATASSSGAPLGIEQTCAGIANRRIRRLAFSCYPESYPILFDAAPRKAVQSPAPHQTNPPREADAGERGVERRCGLDGTRREECQGIASFRPSQRAKRRRG